MLINSDYVAPAELTGYVRAALADMQQNRFRLAAWLPNRTIDDLQYRFDRGGAEGLAEAATFRGYDTESPIGSRPGITRVTGELPPVSRKIRLGEYDRLRQRRLNTRVRGQILTDAERMTRSVAARIELARGEALYKGKIDLAENGIIASVDFGRSSSHTVNAATAWTDTANATPLTDLIAWAEVYRTTNGVAPGVVLLSSAALGLLIRNAEVRALAATVVGTPNVVPQATLQGIFQAHGLPPFEVYDAQVRVSGSSQYVIPRDKVLLLPAAGDANDPESSEMGATLWGTTAESLEPEFSLEEGEEPGIVAGAYSTKDPVAVWTKAAAVSLPILANPDMSFCADIGTIS
ncbi:major capsid protein [Streptomyces sp. NPDC101166]|uniref:major capsid protein n=1 Tax=Streptomyces sp. NPDC101166 TaxID=3366120 RepID=UPI0038186E46